MRVFVNEYETRGIATTDDLSEITACFGLYDVLCCDPEALIETEGLIEIRDYEWDYEWNPAESCWYAYQETSEDPWDNGTRNKDEAISTLRDDDCYTQIAVIVNDCCIEEIHKEDVL